MRRLRAVLGLVAGGILVLSSLAHSFLGWSQLRGSLEGLQAPADLVRSLQIGWQFGGVAIFTFGCIALAVFARALRGHPVSLVPTALIALAYVAFGLWALAVSKNPFFLIFIVPGSLLALASTGREGAADS
jgi:hypothetical protein